MTKKTMICTDNSDGYENLLIVGKAYEVSDDSPFYGFKNERGGFSSAYQSRFAKPIPAPVVVQKADFKFPLFDRLVAGITLNIPQGMKTITFAQGVHDEVVVSFSS